MDDRPFWNDPIRILGWRPRPWLPHRVRRTLPTRVSQASLRPFRGIRGQPATPRLPAAAFVPSSECGRATADMLSSPQTMCPLRSLAPGHRIPQQRRIETDRGAKFFLAGPKFGGSNHMRPHRQEPSSAQDQHAVRFAPTVEEFSVEGAEDGRPATVTKSPVQSPIQSPAQSPVQSPRLAPAPGFSASRRLNHFHFEPVSLPASRVSLPRLLPPGAPWPVHPANRPRQHPSKAAPGSATRQHT